MPNFDGNGPLKRGGIIGRGRGLCKQTRYGYPQEETRPETQPMDKTSAQNHKP